MYSQQPFTRSNKLRTAVVKREQKNMGPRPKSVDFEVLHVQTKQPNSFSTALELATSQQVVCAGAAVCGEHLQGAAASVQRRGGGAGQQGQPAQDRQALALAGPWDESKPKAANILRVLPKNPKMIWWAIQSHCDRGSDWKTIVEKYDIKPVRNTIENTRNTLPGKIGIHLLPLSSISDRGSGWLRAQARAAESSLGLVGFVRNVLASEMLMVRKNTKESQSQH